MGTPFMPWQQEVADVAGELDPDGRLHYREVVLTIPRQSGKTTELLAQIVDRCFNRADQRVSYTAQSRSDARSKWEDEWKPAVERSAFKRSVRFRLTNGHEAAIWKNGSLQDLMAKTRQAGHGPVRDLGVIDEAFAQTDDRLEQAMSPSMITRPEPQLWIVSTAGDAESTFLLGKVERARDRIEAGEDPLRPSRTAFFEWAARDDEDPLAESTWWGCMPALGRTVPVAAVRAEAESMALDEFSRAYCNLWVKKGKVVALPGWPDRVDTGSVVRDPVMVALDAAPNMVSASICVAGLNDDGKLHVEVAVTGLGTGWVVERLRAIQATHGPLGVLVGSSGPAAALIPDLRNAGLLAGDYKGESIGTLAKASQLLLDKVKNGDVVHLGQPELMFAVDGAYRKAYGDGGFLWNRHGSSVDISPLVAATLALWGFVNRPEPADATPMFAFSK